MLTMRAFVPRPQPELMAYSLGPVIGDQKVEFGFPSDHAPALNDDHVSLQADPA